jgi:predicted kinase
MALGKRSTTEETIPAPALLILTGASHTGKTSVAEAILEKMPPPAAFLSVDNILTGTLRRPIGDTWSNIPLAYELLQAETSKLLEQGWFVIFESTFTFVPPRRNGEFHGSAVEGLIDEAARLGAPASIVQLRASREILLTRAQVSGRLDTSIVASTIALHERACFPLQQKVIETDTIDASAGAAAIINLVGSQISSER